MEKLHYVNGEYVTQERAVLPIFDRAIMFSDAVYEVICFMDGKLLDFHAHIARLSNSLEKLDINYECDNIKLLNICRHLIEQNSLINGLIYLQVTRGAAKRDFHINPKLTPNIFIYTDIRSSGDLANVKLLHMQSCEDKRWGLCDIKTTQLLYASLAKSRAQQAGKDDALFIKDGVITEASSANFHIIDNNNNLITSPLNGNILPGITRARLLSIAQKEGINVIEKTFSLQEAQNAKEAFISSATTFVHPVISIDDRIIGDGRYGKIAAFLREKYLNEVERI